MSLEVLDLRPLSRGSANAMCEILVEAEDGGFRQLLPWLILGEVSFIASSQGERHIIEAALPEEMTDFEHSPVKLVSFEVIGLRFERLYQGVTYFGAHIPYDRSSRRSFRIPAKGYDPGLEAETCTHCETPHPIVNVAPHHCQALLEEMQGRRIEIRVGPVR